MLFVGIVSLATLSYIGLGAYWWLYFYERVDWVTVIGSEAMSRLPLFVVFAAYVTVLGDSFTGLVFGQREALGTTGGVASLAAVLLACPSCAVALFLLLASAGLVGGSALSMLQHLNQVQAYAGYFTIFGTTLMLIGIYVLTNGHCPVPSSRRDRTVPQ